MSMMDELVSIFKSTMTCEDIGGVCFLLNRKSQIFWLFLLNRKSQIFWLFLFS